MQTDCEEFVASDWSTIFAKSTFVTSLRAHYTACLSG